MKLAIDCRFIGKSGIGTYIFNIVRELVVNHPENSYLLITDYDFNFFDESINVRILRTSIQPFTIRELLFFPVKEINQCDAYFSPNFNLPGRINVPVYSTIHDVIFLDLPELSGRIGRLIRKLYYYLAVRRSRIVYTVSEFSKSRIEHFFSDARNIVVTYSAISSHIKNAPIDSARKENYYIYVGNVKKHKGLALLVKAFAIAKEKGLTSKLYIVGESSRFRTADGEFSQLIASTDDIQYTGFVDDSKLIELIAHAKALVLPSFYEGLGLPPMEALYLGTQVIISDIPVFKEIYSSLPVEFFQNGNMAELSHVLLTFEEQAIDTCRIRAQIDKTYNFKNITQIILDTINNDYKK